MRAIEKKAADEAEKRRSGSYRLDGDYETLLLSRGRRAMKDASMAKDIEEKVEEEVQALISAMSTLQAAYWRVLSSSKKRTEQRKRTTVNDPKWKLDDAVQESLRSHGISVQRYWNGAVSNIYLLNLLRKLFTLNLSQLVGPDCRRFLLLFGLILSDPASKITEAGHSKAEADDFVQRHTAVLEPLLIVGHLTRAVRMLSADKISELKLACVRFGAAWGGWV